jgi:hypothetical protein
MSYPLPQNQTRKWQEAAWAAPPAVERQARISFARAGRRTGLAQAINTGPAVQGIRATTGSG